MDWNWDAISAISSVIGGIGVILSVVFLVYEVRRNALAIEGATVQSLMSLERDVFAMFAAHADLCIRGNQDRSGLSEADRYRYDRVVASYMSLVYSASIQFDGRLIDQDCWEAYRNAARSHLDNPGFRESWQTFRHGYPRSFMNVVEGLYASVAVPPDHQPAAAATQTKASPLTSPP